jgi:predicted MPP superfamily phosphohydrolase
LQKSYNNPNCQKISVCKICEKEMKFAKTQKVRLSEKISSAARSDTPLRDLASNFSLVARYALAEANTLTTEKINITLKRLPKNLDGFRIVHLSDIHHSPFTSLEHITRAVEIANSLEPDMFVLTGDFVSHESEYIAPMAKVIGTLKSEFGIFACLGNHDHWTDAELVTNFLRGENITVLINEGFRFVARGSSFWLCGVDDYMVGQTDLRSARVISLPLKDCIWTRREADPRWIFRIVSLLPLTLTFRFSTTAKTDF